MRLWIVGPLALLLGSCATLDKAECLGGDWAGIGLKDGAAGAPMSRVDDHAKACTPHGVTPDLAAWTRGREQGLVDYCRPQRGFDEGVQGASYHQVCPDETEGAFLEAYSDGRQVYAAQQDVERYRSDYYDAMNRANDVVRDIQEYEKRLADPALSPQERDSIRSTLRRLRDEHARWLYDAERARREERRAQSWHDELRARMSAKYG